MNIKNKLLVVCFIIATLFTIFTITFPIQVKASDISTYAYYDPNTVSLEEDILVIAIIMMVVLWLSRQQQQLLMESHMK